MKKLYSICIILLGVPLFVCAQIEREMPQWVTQLPAANPRNHYYYRVTIGEGPNYDKAYAAAFAKAIMEAKWKIGVRVNMSDDVSALEEDITKAINVQEQSMAIPINKVCDYWEEFYRSSTKMTRLYVLWQIADDGSVNPKFEDFTNCQ